MTYDFSEALKVLKAGYKVGRQRWDNSADVPAVPSYMRLEGRDFLLGKKDQEETAFLWLSEFLLADDFYTIDPPHITGELHIVLEDNVGAAL